MNIEIDTSKCTQSKIWLDDEGHPVHKTLMLGVTGVFICLGSITEKNLDDWKLRIMLARQLGMLHDVDVQTQDLVDHIGLKIDTRHKQTRQWWQDLTAIVFNEMQREVEGYEDRTQHSGPGAGDPTPES